MSVKNGLSAIAKDVVGDVQKEAEAVISAAEQEAKETLRAAKEEADQNYRAKISQTKTKAEAEKRKIASLTEVEIRNSLLQAKEDLVDIAFQKAQEKLKAFAESEAYHDYLLASIQKAAERMGQNNLTIQVNSKDKEWLTSDVLKRLSKKLHVELKITDKTGDYLGGCIIQTDDEKMILDVTLDNRLMELKPVLRVELAKTLFGEA
jgi:V/A-type H+/Na+-transporting ATPase subunit E